MFIHWYHEIIHYILNKIILYQSYMVFCQKTQCLYLMDLIRLMLKIQKMEMVYMYFFLYNLKIQHIS